jgi:ubiquinone/menaquinone biosynthesis C-methylase UbiE
MIYSKITLILFNSKKKTKLSLNQEKQMKNESLVKIEENHVLIPKELYEYLDKQNNLIIYTDANPNRLRIRKHSQSIKEIARKLLMLGKNGIHKKITFLDEFNNMARYKISNNKASLGHYRIANYDTFFLLIAQDEYVDSKSRQNTWKDIENYHEHLKSENQNIEARMVSQYLKDKMKEFSPESVLEMGCGAGRNLECIQKGIPTCTINGFDINPVAIEVANDQTKEPKDIKVASIYETSHIPSQSVDIVFSAGVLMHIPEDKVGDIIKEMNRIAKKVVLHFELHGPSHTFDYHRYPRDYEKKYINLFQNKESFTYEVFSKDDYRSKGTGSFNHCLLVNKI